MSKLRQLLLDLEGEPAPSFDNFVAGDSNIELLAHLRALATAGTAETIYLWGTGGSGRSHLLAATASLAATQRPCRLLANANIHDLNEGPPGELLIVDDIDRLDAAGQASLFRCFIAAAAGRLSLLLAGTEPPLRLTLREDLRTRIGQALVFEIKPLSEDDMSAALRRRASERGMRLEPPVLQYLLHRRRRELNSLLATLDALDQASLELQRPPTLPLLREILHSAANNERP
jgi:DnaA family protein